MTGSPETPPESKASEHAINLTPSPRSGTIPPIETRWKPGICPNSKGRGNVGWSVLEFLRELADKSTDQLRLLASDDTIQITKRIAASRLLAAVDDGEDFDRILNRFLGRPVQGIAVVAPPVADPLEATLEAMPLDTVKALAAAPAGAIDAMLRQIERDDRAHSEAQTAQNQPCQTSGEVEIVDPGASVEEENEEKPVKPPVLPKPLEVADWQKGGQRATKKP